MNISSSEYKWMVEQTCADMINMLVEKENKNLSEALNLVYNSDTYKALNSPSSGWFYQSPGYVFSYLMEEINTGKLF